MIKKQETISDIVAEMRRLNPEKFLSTPWYCEPLPNKMRSYADRIEAAAKSIEADRDNWRRQALDEDARANAATIKESLTVGNTAAMRAALEQIHELLSIGGKPDTSMCIRYEAAYQIAKEALSAPPRNCDVGNEKEQSERLDAFCSKHFRYGDANPCSQCPVAAESDSSLPCVFRFLQLPYELEAGTKDYSNVREVCFDCARKAGFVQKKKAVIPFEDECDICKARRPCTDLHHDWIPPKKKAR